MDVKKIWEDTLELIEPSVTSVVFNTWFKDAKPISIEEDTLVLSMTNELMSKMLKRYSALIQNALQSVTGKWLMIEFTEGLKPVNIVKGTLNTEQNTAPTVSYLNPKYTFDSFVVGNSNRYAHAVSVAVGEAPGEVYNPLLIYGGSGLGKTHLMQAIANYAHDNNPDMKIVYISSEKFTNELISAITTRSTAQFRNKYRNVDMLLIDDVQFLEGKEMAQEEFFHTFNDLHDTNKQIIMTSDRHPREIKIEERLQSRFVSGCLADIQPPDYETRIAILQKKAEGEEIEIPYDVYCYMADSIKSNIRELEGALTRILSYAKITGKTLDLALAEEALSAVIQREGVVRITAKSINDAVSKYYNIPIADIKGKRKTQDISDARQMAMYLCRELTDMSFVVIGKEYGNRHYTTVMHAVDNIKKNMENDSELYNTAETLKKQLRTILN
ncbi:MAG: chromosomal replication initiator protein DnaA [Clostridia bacterium]|nr:chromosomal replication initiator protein DnaA [Clostridia bacterium]